MCETFHDITVDDDNGDKVAIHRELMKQLCKYQKELLENAAEWQDGYEVIGLPECRGVHLFHKACLNQQMTSGNGEFIKCAVCETTYGKRVGDMPDGTMKWVLCEDKADKCQGYE